MKYNGFVGPAYTHQSLQVSAQTCKNLYIETTDNMGKEAQILVGTPGYTRFATVSDAYGGGCRGLFYTTQNRLFVVRGYSVVEVNSSGIEIPIGQLLTNVGTVSIAENQNQLMFTDGTYGYILTKADNTLVQITDTSFPASPQFVIYQDGYFITNAGGTNQFYLSQLNDGLLWTPVTFVSAEGSPDIISKITSTNGQLWVFGEKSYEVWYNAGDPLFPYQRIPGSYNSIGLLAPESAAVILNTVFFLGGSKDGFGTVYMSNGYQVTQISTYPIEAEIAGFHNPADAVGFTYQQDGHYFYVLSFQAGNKTFVYDVQEKAWHTRTSYNTISTTEGRWRAVYQSFAFNKNIVGDYNTGDLWELSTSVFTENGTPILRERTAPVLFSNDDYKFITYKSLEIDMRRGVGLLTGQGSDPQIMMQFSNDGGITWSNEYWTSIGKIGEYANRVKWNRLGRSNFRVFRIRISDPIKVVIMGAVIDILKGET